jgi:hypothetical protein
VVAGANPDVEVTSAWRVAKPHEEVSGIFVSVMAWIEQAMHQ